MSKNKINVKTTTKESPKITNTPSGILTRKKSVSKTQNVQKTNFTQAHTKKILVENKENQTDFKQTNSSLTDELLSKTWISDQSVTQHIELLNYFFLENSNLCILNPLIVHAVKNITGYSDYLEPLQLYDKDYLLMPLNNSQKLAEEGGSHWSTLIFDKQSKQFFHYDSIGGSNICNARKIADKILLYMTGESVKTVITEVKCPQQVNGYDCGIYMLHIIDLLVSNFLSTKSIDSSVVSELSLSDTDLIVKRSVLAYIISNNYKIPAASLLSLITIPTKKVSNLKGFLTESTQTDLSSKSLELSQFNKRKIAKTIEKPISNLRLLSSNNTLDMSIDPEEIIEAGQSVAILGDSHGRYLARELQNRLGKNSRVTEIIKPGAKFMKVMELMKGVKLVPDQYLTIFAGANDVYNGHPENVYLNLKSFLHSFKSCKVVLAGIPFRHDLPLFHKVNEEIMNMNLFFYEQSRVIKNVSFLDLTAMSDKCYNKDGIHLNILGKKLIIQRLCKEINTFSIPKQTKFDTPNTFHDTHTEDTNPTNACRMENPPFKVVENNMREVISNYQHDRSVAFAHSISADFSHDRHMTAGVATIFKQKFGKPSVSSCINSHLAFQGGQHGAGVYSLITKPKYHGKPTNMDYDTAFKQLAEDFKTKGFKQLICSPIGCVRDEIKLEHFINNLSKFQSLTGATITIVSYNQTAHRTLRRGMTHEQFQSHMHSVIEQLHSASEPSTQNLQRSPQTTTPWHGWSSPQLQSSRDKLSMFKVTTNLDTNLPKISSNLSLVPSPNTSPFQPSPTQPFLENINQFPPLI